MRGLCCVRVWCQAEEVTADRVYLRLHGFEKEHAWDYSEQELAPYVEKASHHGKAGGLHAIPLGPERLVLLLGRTHR